MKRPNWCIPQYLRKRATQYLFGAHDDRGHDACLYLAGVLERAEEVRSDTLNGVVNYILNGEDRMEDETQDGVTRDFDRLRDLVDERVALGAVAFTARAGRWGATLNREPMAYADKLAHRAAAYKRARQYLAEGMTHFTVIEGPWTVYLTEELK